MYGWIQPKARAAPERTTRAIGEPGIRRRSGIALTLAALVALLSPFALRNLSMPPLAAAQTTNSGVAVTLAATGEDIDAASPGLIVQIRLDNRTGRDLSDVTVKAPIPPQMRVADSYVGSPGTSPGSLQGQTMVWSSISLKSAERPSPMTLRLVPTGGADGSKIFRHASMTPEIIWGGPAAGQATIAQGGLLLNGLWGEANLRRTLLPSGLTVITRERPDSTTVSIRLSARAGSRDEDSQTRGGSHWLEHAHFLGTTHRENLDTELSAVGGEAGASTGWEATNYWYRVPMENFDLALDLLADQMLYSTFPRAAFEREKLVVAEELKRRVDTSSIHAFDEFINTVFKASPLRQHPSGTIESVLSIPIDTILTYKNQRYISGNMAIAVAGNIRHDDAVSKIERAFASLPQGARSPRPPVPEPIETDMRRRAVGEGDRLAEIRLGWPAPGDDNDADSSAMTILDDILGTTGRRLTEEIKDRRALATSVDSDYLDFSDAGALMLSATTQPDKADQVVALLLDQIRRLQSGDVTDADVRASVRAIAGRRAIQDESNSQQTGRAEVEVSETLESWEESMTKLRAVTAADVKRVANKYLDPQNYTLVVVRG